MGRVKEIGSFEVHWMRAAGRGLPARRSINAGIGKVVAWILVAVRDEIFEWRVVLGRMLREKVI